MNSQTVHLLLNGSMTVQDFMIIMMARSRVDYCETVDVNESYIGLTSNLELNNLLVALATEIIDSS